VPGVGSEAMIQEANPLTISAGFVGVTTIPRA
jgi:hypothetical protein